MQKTFQIHVCADSNKLLLNFPLLQSSSQNIALYEWLPGYLGDTKLPPYPGKNHPAEYVCAQVEGNR